MRFLLDNCVPRKLAGLIHGHTVRTAVEEHLAHLSDKALLNAIAGLFDALITVDRGFAHQQNMVGRPIVVGLIKARSNSLSALAPHAAARHTSAVGRQDASGGARPSRGRLGA